VENHLRRRNHFWGCVYRRRVHGHGRRNGHFNLRFWCNHHDLRFWLGGTYFWLRRYRGNRHHWCNWRNRRFRLEV